MPTPKRTARRKPARDPRSSRGQVVAQEITDKLIARLEEGGPLPWRRPWRSSATAIPLRATGEAYKGINHMLLGIETACSGYTTPYWMTFRQAKELGGSVRKGERATTVIYYGTAPKKGEAAEAAGTGNGSDYGEEGGMYRFLKCYAVFNCDQIDGLPEKYHPVAGDIDTGVRADEQLSAFFGRMPFGIDHGHEYAAYLERTDRIVMPDASRFESKGAYFATLAHEGIHGTGVRNRLDRTCFADYHADNEARAAEELVAEIGSMMLTAYLGIAGEHIDNHAAYIQSWLRALKSDRRHIFKAAAAAQTACDWMIDKAGVRGAASDAQEAA